MFRCEYWSLSKGHYRIAMASSPAVVQVRPFKTQTRLWLSVSACQHGVCLYSCLTVGDCCCCCRIRFLLLQTQAVQKSHPSHYIGCQVRHTIQCLQTSVYTHPDTSLHHNTINIHVYNLAYWIISKLIDFAISLYQPHLSWCTVPKKLYCR